MLAAPVLSLGLPTLVILNMADDLARRGGGADPVELAEQLGTPVAMVSASKGTGVDKVFQFLDGATAAPHKPPRVELPVIQNIPQCRAWAAKVGSNPNIMRPRLRCGRGVWTAIFLHPVVGPLVFAAGGDRGLSDHLFRRQARYGRDASRD